MSDAVNTTPGSTRATCPSCRADIEPGDPFCDQCGAAVGAAPAERGRTPASRGERKQAMQELRRARKALAAVQLGFRASAVIALLFTVLFASWWYRFDARGWGDVAVRIMALFTLASAVEAIALWFGAHYVRRAPLVLSLVLAALSTVATGTLMMQVSWGGAGGLLVKVVLVARLLYSLGLWLLVPGVLRLKRVLEEHPELGR